MAVKRSGQLSLADALVVRGSGGKGRLERLEHDRFMSVRIRS